MIRILNIRKCTVNFKFMQLINKIFFLYIAWIIKYEQKGNCSEIEKLITYRLWKKESGWVTGLLRESLSILTFIRYNAGRQGQGDFSF